MYNLNMIKKLSYVLHTLSCDKEHAQKMEDMLDSTKKDLCFFYLEETLIDDERYTHREWEAKASKLCYDFECTPEDILRWMPVLLECHQKLAPILQKSPNAEGLCRLVLFPHDWYFVAPANDS